MAILTINERMRFDSAGNLGLGTSPRRSIKMMDFTVFQEPNGYLVRVDGSGDMKEVKTYAEVEELFRLRFAEWKLEQD
jgi:hypothetical protein